MAPFSSCARLVPILAMAVFFISIPVYGQISTSCSASMISSFTPCLNFLTNSTANGTSPSAGCCNALKSLTSGSKDCMCLIVTGNVPFQIPINRTLAISLPRACNMPGVPLQCKGTTFVQHTSFVVFFYETIDILMQIFCTSAAAGAPIPAPGTFPTLNHHYFYLVSMKFFYLTLQGPELTKIYRIFSHFIYQILSPLTCLKLIRRSGLARPITFFRTFSIS
jgi:hypothetical protein